MGTCDTIDFRKIVLGKADALEESVEYPDLLLKGYYDQHNVVELIHSTSKFLVLGYKGSGKSALSSHLKLSSENGEIVSQQSLKDFPYKQFAKITSGDGEIEYRLKVAWRWLLLVQILSDLIHDKDAAFAKHEDVKAFVDFMTRSGVFPLMNMSALVTKTMSNTFKGSVQSFSYEHTTSSENTQISFEWLINYVKTIIENCKEHHNHILVIDGLDDILTSREIQYQAIAALINEAKDLNVFFRSANIPCKVIVLCRTDIFERLPDGNKNKTRRDCSFTFTWYKEGSDKQNDCGLIDILNLRGRLVYPDIEDVIATFFPRRIDNEDIYSYLLELTRHTPRDFMQLLVSIQSHCKTERPSIKDIHEGIKEYSNDYFMPEIKDEMAGYIPYQIVDPIINILGSFRTRVFSFKEFRDRFMKAITGNANTGIANTPDAVLSVLYDCSAIGHVYGYCSGKERITFKYRNRSSSFNTYDKIILHKGLWKALNVNF